MLWRPIAFAKALNVSPVTALKLFDRGLVRHIRIDGTRLAVESPADWLDRIKAENLDILPPSVTPGEKRKRGRPKKHSPEMKAQP